MNYLPSTSEIEILRRLFQNRIGDAWYAVLGDRLGTGARTDVPGKPGWVYIMFLNGGDTNGNVTYTAPTMVRAAGVAFPNVPGTGLWVGYGYDGDLCVKAAHNKALDAMGINTQVLNPLNQQSRFVYPWQLTYGMVNAVGNSTTPSTLVTVKKIRHYTGGNLLQPYETPLQADKIDLASYIPAADTHCYAMVWLDTYTNDPAVTTSVTQALSSPLTDADLQECVVRSASSRPPDAIPFKAFYLSNDQGSITQNDLDVDVRQWLDMPNVWGFPNVLTTLERIRANYTLVTGPFTTSGVGDLDTSETGARLLIVHKSNISTSAPTVNDDSDDGYSVGSRWFRSSTGVLYIATDVTTGAAVWDTVNAGGGSFAPDNATYLLQVANGSLPNAQAMGALSTGIVKNTATTGVQSIAVAGTDYTSPTGTENLSNKTINASDIGTTTPGAGYFSALRLKLGGLFGIFTHANSADRTYTLPNYNATLSPMTTAGDTVYFDGTDNVRLAKGTARQHYKMNAGATAPEWAAGLTIDFQAFTSSGAGTWNKPPTAVFVDVICVGAGGGGGGGRRSTATSIRGGGGGGAGGAVTRMQWSAGQLGSSESLNVGLGGTPGAAPAVDNQNGGDGGTGGASWFGGTTSTNCKLIAQGGGGGGGGAVSVGGTGGAGQTALSNTYQFYNAGGGVGGTSGTPVVPVNAQWGPGNGGGGGGINASGTASGAAAGSSGSAPAYGSAVGGGGGAAGTTSSGTGGAGAAGTTNGTSVFVFGAGGGGGAPDTTIGRSGGNGGLPGGGGGGAGATLNGNNGFPGGTGADGAVIVISYCY